MDIPDLTVVYAKDGENWKDYLEQCFQQLIPQNSGERPLRIHSQKLECLAFPLSPSRVAFLRSSKAQLVILTPEFLDFVQDHPGTVVGQLFEPVRVVAMLCGVEKRDVQSTHRAELLTFPQWHIMSVRDQDKEFVLQLFRKTVEVMELAEEGAVGERPQFKLTPRKVREGNNKVFALLHSPISVCDQELRVYLTSSRGKREEVANFKVRNPFTVQFNIPDAILKSCQILSVQLTCDGVSLGVRQLKCESQMGELNNLLMSVNSPFAFLCQTIGVTGTKELDRLLVQNFKKNLVAGDQHVFQCGQDTPPRKSQEQYPTLLHFAAHYGFREFCSRLLDCPNANIACRVRNLAGLTPTDLADAAGHKALAHMLNNFENLSLTADLYTYASRVQDLPDSDSSVYDNVHHLYDYPRSIPLYDSPVSIPVRVQQNWDREDLNNMETYLPMSRGSTPSLAANYLEPHRRLLLGLDDDNSEPAPLDSHFMEPTAERANGKPTADRTGYTPSQVELLEILEDFKQNKYSMNEVEQLFEDWKLRQTVQSFDEKEKQLAALRTKYEEIQHCAPDKGKKSLSLERVKSVLTSKKSKKPTPPKQKPPQKKDEVSYEELKNRPVSTLSTSSNSSSSTDRSSTLSNLSTASNTTKNTECGVQFDGGEETARTRKDSIDSQVELRTPKARLAAVGEKRMSVAIKDRIAQFETSSFPPPLPSFREGSLRQVLIQNNNNSRNSNNNQSTTPPTKKTTINIENRSPQPLPRLICATAPKYDDSSSSPSPDYVVPDPPSAYDLPVSQRAVGMPRKGSHPVVSNNDLMMHLKNTRSKTVPDIRQGGALPNRRVPTYVNLDDLSCCPDEEEQPITDESEYYNWSLSLGSKLISKAHGNLEFAGGDKLQKLLDPYPWKLSLGVVPVYQNFTDVHLEGVPIEPPPPPPIVPRLPPRSTMIGRPLPAIPQ